MLKTDTQYKAIICIWYSSIPEKVCKKRTWNGGRCSKCP